MIVLTLIVMGITARLSWWQLSRAHTKETLAEAIVTQAQREPLTAGELPRTTAEREAQLYRRIQISGRWLSQHTVYLDNRQMDGRPGFFVMTPLLLDDGSAVLVQRGWMPRDFMQRDRITPPPTAQDVVAFVGRIAPPPARLLELDTAGGGPIRQNLVLDEFGLETRLRLRPLNLLQLTPAVPEGAAPDALRRDWPLPAADVHKHYGYAFQWAALCLLTLVLALWFLWIQPARLARQP